MTSQYGNTKRRQFGLGTLFSSMFLVCLCFSSWGEFGAPGVIMLFGLISGAQIGWAISPRVRWVAIGATVGSVVGTAIGMLLLFVQVVE